MKKSSIGAVFLLSSSALANPYKSEFVDVAFQIQEGKKHFNWSVNPSSPWGSCPKTGLIRAIRLARSFWSWLSKAE
ncbi:hypothetical protein ACK3Z7_09180 [Aeromonas caviae]